MEADAEFDFILGKPVVIDFQKILFLGIDQEINKVVFVILANYLQRFETWKFFRCFAGITDKLQPLKGIFIELDQFHILRLVLLFVLLKPIRIIIGDELNQLLYDAFHELWRLNLVGRIIICQIHFR